MNIWYPRRTHIHMFHLFWWFLPRPCPWQCLNYYSMYHLHTHETTNIYWLIHKQTILQSLRKYDENTICNPPTHNMWVDVGIWLSDNSSGNWTHITNIQLLISWIQSISRYSLFYNFTMWIYFISICMYVFQDVHRYIPFLCIISISSISSTYSISS